MNQEQYQYSVYLVKEALLEKSGGVKETVKKVVSGAGNAGEAAGDVVANTATYGAGKVADDATRLTDKAREVIRGGVRGLRKGHIWATRKGRKALKYAEKNPLTAAGIGAGSVAAAGGAAYGAKKLYDRHQRKKMEKKSNQTIHDFIMEQSYLHKTARHPGFTDRHLDPAKETVKKVGKSAWKKATKFMGKHPYITGAGAVGAVGGAGLVGHAIGKGSGRKQMEKESNQTIHDFIMEQAYLCS